MDGARYQDLLEGIDLWLADVTDEVDYQVIAGLGEAVGALSASGDSGSLRRAVTATQRRITGEPGPVAEYVLTLCRSVLAAAASTQAGQVAQDQDARRSVGVRQRVLEAVTKQPSLRTSEIASQLGIAVPQASRALHELAERGLVVSGMESETDRRTRRWQLSAAARLEHSPYACLADLLTAAVTDAGNYRSDMLPVGPADRCDPGMLSTMTERLVAAVNDGRYKPVPAQFFDVAKDSDTSRPAALLRLPDRIVYTALSQGSCAGLDAHLGSAVRWPRGTTDRPSWSEFERAPLELFSEYVVVADVASFYDTIDHDKLRDSLVKRGGRREVVEALHSFLGTVMGRKVGLPQGLPASDPLATAALAQVDEELQAAGFIHFRHGDDFRVIANTRHEARTAITTLGNALRAQRLHLSTSKTFPIPTARYRENVSARDEALDEVLKPLRIAMGFANEAGLLGGNEGFNPEADPGLDGDGGIPAADPDLERLLELPARDDGLRVVVGRYGEVEDIWLEEPQPWDDGSAELLEELMSAVADSTRSSAEKLRAAGRTTWQVKLSRELFSTCLSVLSSVGYAIEEPEWWVSLVQDLPHETRTVATYLAHLARRGSGELPAEVSRRLLKEPGPDWQRAWILASVASSPDPCSEPLLSDLTLELESGGWLTRLAAASVLQRADALTSTQLHSLWTDAPYALRPDLVVLLARSEPTGDVLRALNDEADDMERVLAHSSSATLF